ncbi:MAG: phenylacetate--CoA ligase family protein [Lautropia sp.]
MSTGGYWNEALETLPWPQVLAWQATQLDAFVGPLRRRSALYARLHAAVPDPAAIRSIGDLQRLPFTTKDDIRAAQDAATDAMPLGANQGVPIADVVQVLSSSGTTGSPLYYGLSAADVERIVDAVANTFFTAGIRRTDVVAHLVGLPMVAGGLPYADAFRRIGATLCWLGGFPTERILREMRRLRASAVLATTSFAQHLAERGDDPLFDGVPPSALRKVVCGGEPGLNQPEIRRRIVEGLGIDHLRETMGLGDVIPSIWGECEAQQGMHFNAQQYVAVELIDPASGEAVDWREGARGELVYTALVRDATPLVRYRSRDHALVTGVDRCACGRTSPRVRCIGRTDDMLIYKGMNVFPTAIRDLVVQAFAGRCEPVLRIWKDRADQVRFESPLPLEVEAAAMVDAADYPSLAQQIEAKVRSELQVRVAVRVLAPGSIERGVYKTPLVRVR